MWGALLLGLGKDLIIIKVALIHIEGNKVEWRGSIYMHIVFEMGLRGIENMLVTIIDKTNINEATQREGFWAYKLNSFIPHGLNQRDFL